MGIRVTGFTAWILGLTWEYTLDEKRRLQSLLEDLADRRLLYHDSCGDFRNEMMESVMNVRRATTECIKGLDTSELRCELRKIIGDCHEFQSKLERGGGVELHHMWLGEFRRGVVDTLGPLCEKMELDVPDVFVTLIESYTRSSSESEIDESVDGVE